MTVLLLFSIQKPSWKAVQLLALWSLQTSSGRCGGINDPRCLLPPLMEVHSTATLIQTHLHKERGMEGQTESMGGRACYPSFCLYCITNIHKQREVRKHLMLHSCPRHWIRSLRRELGCSLCIILSSFFPERYFKSICPENRKTASQPLLDSKWYFYISNLIQDHPYKVLLV